MRLVSTPMGKIAIFFTLILLPLVCQAQIAFEKVFGCQYNDGGIEVHQTPDAGYIIGATSDVGDQSVVNYDFWLLKTDEYGDTSWTKTFGGQFDETCRGMALTSEGGYILTGWTESFASGYEDVYLVKTNKDGNFIWQKSFGGPDDYDAGYSVKQTNDGGYIITGETGCFGAVGYDVYLVKTDSLGNLVWQKNYGYGYTNDYGRDVQQTSDEGYIVVGYTGISGGYEVYIIKTDSIGEILWTKVYYGGGYFDMAWSVQQTSDNGYIIAGTKAVNGDDIWLIKTDSIGDTLWTNTYGGPATDHGYSVDITSDEGYIITGWTRSYGPATTNVYLVKTDRFGGLLWQEYYYYYNSENYGYYVEQTSDDEYIIVGNAGVWISGGSDVYLIKVAGTGIQEDIKNPGGFNLSVFPKICRSSIEIHFYLPNRQRVSLSLFDVLGRKVKTLLYQKEIQGRNRISLKTSNIPSGTYFLVLETEKGILREKFVNFAVHN